MKLHATLLVLLVLACISGFSQTTSQGSLTPGHYVVVAAYLEGQETYAQQYSTKLNQEGKTAKYGFDDTRKMYYVYTDERADLNESVSVMLKTRQNGFPTAWVRVMKVPPTAPVPTPVPEKKVEPVPVAETKKEETKPPPAPAVVPKADTVKTPEMTALGVIVDNPPADPVYRPQVLTNTPVFLSLYDPSNKKVVAGNVEVVDTEHSRLLQKVKGNDYLQMPDPGTKSGQLTLISSSFGYRTVQHELNYKSTEKDTLQSYVALVGNYYMISFEMVRLRKGDIQTLYNVYFYNDAAIMLPDSKYELNQLLDMMKSNPTYRIVLHGHTNGRSAGKLITRGPSNNFFEITSDVKHGVGSAKDLSRERAQIIKDWLVSSGIQADRMEIKAWGGQRMIHDKDGANARKNVRVEVEVLQD